MLFNPTRVASYRLIGYEKRSRTVPRIYRLGRSEIGAGQAVTALYEIVLTSSDVSGSSVTGTDFLTTKSSARMRAAKSLSQSNMPSTANLCHLPRLHRISNLRLPSPNLA